MANEFRDIGRDIRDAVLDAVNSGDFSQLNSRITGSVSAAIDEVNERLNRREQNTPKKDAFPRWEGNRYHPSDSTVAKKQQERQIFAKRAPGFTAGVLCTIFGSILSAGFGIAFFIILLNFLLGALGKVVFAGLGIAFGALTVGGLMTLFAGQKRLALSRRFRRYVAILRGKTHMALSELAERVGRSERFVLRDVRSMIGKGCFLQGHIDEEQKTLLLTDEVYSHYRNLKQREEELIARHEETAEETLFRETAEQGELYLTAIRRANDAIPGEAVSAKLYRLEGIVQKIFEQVKREPAQIPELRRFLDYYMPTTQKLVETYQRLDAQPMAGHNITTAKEEIERTLDTINLAFENLFDSLFEHTAVDITSDIAVLKNMLHQEGLTGSDFKR